MKPYSYRGLRQELGLSSKEYSLLYQSWQRMNRRCSDPNNASYKHYAERGIKVCVEWKYSFENFLRWAIENGWRKELSLDRIDNDGDYTPTNCRWATLEMQGRNKRNCVYLTHNGETKSLIEWCEIYGVPHYLPTNRLRRGCTDFDKLFSKVDWRSGGDLYY